MTAQRRTKLTVGILALVALIAAGYFGGQRYLLGHQFFTKYSDGTCIENRSTETVFLVEGNAKDSYFGKVIRSGKTVPGSFQVGKSFALDVNATDGDETFRRTRCLQSDETTTAPRD